MANLQQQVPLRHSLLFRSILYLCVSGFALFLFSSAIYLAWQERVMEKRLVHHGRSYLSMLVENTADSIAKGQRNSFQQVINSFTRVDEVDEVAMYTRTHGLMNYLSNTDTVGLPFVNEDGQFVNPNQELFDESRGMYTRKDWHLVDIYESYLAREHVNSKQNRQQACQQCHYQLDPDLDFHQNFAYHIADTQSHFYYRMAVSKDCVSCHTSWKDGETASYLRITLNNDSIAQQLHENIAGILFVLTAVLAPALLIVIVIIRYVINRPLSKTLKFARNVAVGKRKDTIEVEGNNEISQLNHALNLMMETINSDFNTIKQAEERLNVQKLQLRQVIDLVPDYIYAKSQDGTFLLVNQALADAFGLHPKDMVRKTEMQISGLNPAATVTTYSDDDEVLATGKLKTIQKVQLPRADGTMGWFRTSRIPFLVQGSNDQAILGIAVDITEQLRAREILSQRANTDGLTGLANRRCFDESLQRELRRLSRHEGLLSLIMLDIDYFKGFNDEYGHPSGDECLRKVAGAIQKQLTRVADVAARYGGEEFACILPESDNVGAMVVARRIQAAIAELAIPNKASAVSPFLTVSMGTVTVRCNAHTLPGQLIAEADAMLYAAKNAGRNRNLASAAAQDHTS